MFGFNKKDKTDPRIITANDLAYKFSSCGVSAEILDTQQIYQLLKLFSHPYSSDNNINDDDFAPIIPTIMI